MQKFKKTDSAIMYDFKNIDSLEWYDSENIADLQKWGYKIVLANKKAADYAVHFNTLIHDNIDMCKGLLPDWIKWEYIKSLLLFQNTKTPNILNMNLRSIWGINQAFCILYLVVIYLVIYRKCLYYAL